MDNSYITKSQSIPIANRYNLKHGVFNPIQNSPPNIWSSRLIERINNNVYKNKSVNNNKLEDSKVVF